MLDWRTTLVGLAIVAVVIAATFARSYFHLGGMPSRLTVINHAAEVISDARVRQGDRELAMGAIEPNQTQSTDFISREGSLTLAVEFRHGGTMSADNVAYLAAGVPVNVIFEVTDSEIRLLPIVSRTSSPYSSR